MSDWKPIKEFENEAKTNVHIWGYDIFYARTGECFYQDGCWIFLDSDDCHIVLGCSLPSAPTDKQLIDMGINPYVDGRLV